MGTGTQLGIGMFILLSVIGTTYYVANTDMSNLYSCGEVVGICFKLSAANSAGLQTRCYFNESAPTFYKSCTKGWVKFDMPKLQDSIIGTLTETLTLEETGKGIYDVSYSVDGKNHKFSCDYSRWGKCTFNEVKRTAICDSNKDGNGDGTCQSGESCISIDFNEEVKIEYINTYQQLQDKEIGVTCNAKY